MQKKDSPKMFSRIAKRYNRANRWISLFQDRTIRRLFVKGILVDAPDAILDVATGTGELARGLKKRFPLSNITGMDPSKGMLEIAKQSSKEIDWMEGSAEHIPFGEQTFDLVTISFGIRNIGEMPQALREMKRVTRKGGQIAVLEFGLPDNVCLRAGFLFYLYTLGIFFGWIFTGNASAFWYLARTVRTFPYGADLADLLREHTGGRVEHHAHLFGSIRCYRVFL